MSKLKKHKVIHIQSRLCIGGPVVNTELLSRLSPDQKYKSIIIGGKVEASEVSVISELIVKGLDVRIVQSMRRVTNPLNDIKAIIEIYKLIKKEKPDIVCTHTAKAGTVGRIAGIFARVPLVFHTFHGHTFHSYFPRYLTAFFLFIERLLARFTTKIIAISPSQKHELVDIYRVAPENKFVVIRLGLELSSFYNIVPNGYLKKELNLPLDAPLLGIIGRLAPIKNMNMALRVLSLLQYKNVHLIIVGDGDERPLLEQHAMHLGINDKVHFWGWETDITKIYSGIDMLLLTSKNEGTPVTIIEAMASGVPVVATRVGGVPDIISHQESGYLCQVDNDKEMAEQIMFLLDNPSKTQQICNQARQSVGKMYNAQRLVRDIDRLYSHYLPH